ncbi:MAG: hypothetical protein WC992_06420 [Acholeplasmataceae bacterium]|jgi:hypothetical protein|nr:hypothetical protein [Acholeplasmataceae bacterium]
MNQGGFKSSNKQSGRVPRFAQGSFPKGHIHGQKRKVKLTGSNLSLILGIIVLLGIIVTIAVLIW